MQFLHLSLLALRDLLQKFYKHFKVVLSKRFQLVFSQCLIDKTEEKLILIPKPEKDLSHPQDYRSIALLNLDYNYDID